MLMIFLLWKVDNQIIIKEKSSQIHVDGVEDRVSQEVEDCRLTGEKKSKINLHQIQFSLENSYFSPSRGHYSNYKPYRGRSLRVRGSRGYSR
jgi:hypothetical protein